MNASAIRANPAKKTSICNVIAKINEAFVNPNPDPDDLKATKLI